MKLQIKPKNQKTKQELFLALSLIIIFISISIAAICGEIKEGCSKEPDITPMATESNFPIEAPNPETVEEQIYRLLLQYEISPAGACGILANAKAESDLCPNNLENFYNRKFNATDAEYTNLVDKGEINFVHDAAGYGLWQFTYYSFKQVLFDTAKSNGTSVSDVKTQVEALVKILKTPEFSKLFKFLKEASIPESAAKEFMLVFERPANQSESAITTRAVFATEFYKIFN